MDTFQIRYALHLLIKDIPIYVCASDELQYIPNSGNFAICCNISKSNTDGTHWVALFKSKDMTYIEFFDSVGNDIKFYSLINKFSLQFPYVLQNVNRIQSLTSRLCGNYCILFLLMRSKYVSYESFLSLFHINRLRMNDFIVQDFTRIHYPKFSNCTIECHQKCCKNAYDYSSFCLQSNKPASCVFIRKNEINKFSN